MKKSWRPAEVAPDVAREYPISEAWMLSDSFKFADEEAALL